MQVAKLADGGMCESPIALECCNAADRMLKPGDLRVRYRGAVVRRGKRLPPLGTYSCVIEELGREQRVKPRDTHALRIGCGVCRHRRTNFL